MLFNRKLILGYVTQMAFGGQNPFQ